MSSFIIKIIAIFTMFIDHSGDALIGKTSILNVIGRIAFPLFAFQLVVGYKNTSNLKKYGIDSTLDGWGIVLSDDVDIKINAVKGFSFRNVGQDN